MAISAYRSGEHHAMTAPLEANFAPCSLVDADGNAYLDVYVYVLTLVFWNSTQAFS
jgi:hypothetical protein